MIFETYGNRAGSKARVLAFRECEKTHKFRFANDLIQVRARAPYI